MGIKEVIAEALEKWARGDEDYIEPEVDPFVYIKGLDPGGTTGVAVLRIVRDDDTVPPALVYLHQIPDGQVGFKNFYHGTKGPDESLVIVSEKWKERNQPGADRTPQYIEGGMHMLWGAENIEWQYPETKELIPDAWLKEQNLWTENRRHQMDALKHALAYLRNQGHSATLEALTDRAEEPIAQPGEADEAQLGEGEGEGGAEEALAEAMKALAEAMAEMGEAAEEAAEAIEAMAEAVGEGEPTDEVVESNPTKVTDGDSNGGQTAHADPHNLDLSGLGEAEEDKRTRSKRERNGAFAGYNPADEELGSTVTLFED